MIKIFLLVIGLFFVGNVEARLVTGTVPHNHSSNNTGGGALNLSGSLNSSKECITGYERVNANYCHRSDNALVRTALVNTGACTAISTGFPADAKRAEFIIMGAPNSAGVTGQRFVIVTLYPAAGCTSGTSDEQCEFRVHEQAATAANTVLMRATCKLTSQLDSIGRVWYIVNASSPDDDVHFLQIGYLD